MVAAYTQASFTEGGCAEGANLGLSAEHSGETEASGEETWCFLLCLLFLVGSETQALVHVGRVIYPSKGPMRGRLWPSPVTWEKS